MLCHLITKYRPLSHPTPNSLITDVGLPERWLKILVFLISDFSKASPPSLSVTGSFKITNGAPRTDRNFFM